MKSLSKFFLNCILVLISVSSSFAEQNPSGDGSRKPIVIIVSMDGLPARALQDPLLPMPTLRALAASGAVATAMQPINPTVTWPNHTAIISGVDASRHFVMANGLIAFPSDGSAPQIKPWVDKDQLVHARTLYEAVTEKGMTTAQVDWVAIYGAKGVTWDFGEKPDANGEVPRELIANGMVTREQVEHFSDGSSPAWRDEVWTDAAVDIIEKHAPNLLMLHLLQTDTLQHQYGPLTNAAYAAYAYADGCLKRVVEAVHAAGILDRTTFFVVSDHGFASYTHTIRPNAALAEQGFLHKQGNNYVGSVWTQAEGGTALLYIRDASLRSDLVPKLKTYFAHVSGIAHVYTNEEARSLGLPSESDTDQAPQLYLAAAAGYAFSNEVDGPMTLTGSPRGQHGYLNTMADMQATFVASGAAIRPGIHLGTVSNLQVAPTIATILGVSLPDAGQPAIREILR